MDELLSIFFTFFLVLTGKAIVIVASCGQWRSEPLCANEVRAYSAAGSLWFKRDGQIVVTVGGLEFIGFVFYVLLACVLFWLLLS